MKIDLLSHRHLALCQAIDEASPFPWGGTHWARSLRDDHCLGLWQGATLVAISAYTLVFDELSLMNIVVASTQVGRGYGRHLLLGGLDWMQQLGPSRCVLEVRESNVVARRLYRSVGFGEDGIRKNYYPLGAGREDAVLMSAPLPLDEWK